MAISAIRTVVIYLVLIVAMRIMGKRQLGEMQPTELVVTLMIADLGTVPMQETAIPLLSGIVPILVLLALELLLSGAMLKFPLIARLASGNPVIIAHEGKLDQKAMRRMRLTVDDLYETLRGQGIFDLGEVDYIIAETGGNISVLQKPEFRALTCRDAGKQPRDTGIPVTVISDGSICEWALPLCNINEKWIRKTLQKEQCPLGDVFVMTADKTRNYRLIRREEAR